MDITKFAILKKLAGGGGGSSGHEDEIIARTITNYTNNSATSIGEYAFYYSELESVNFSKATSIGNNAFYHCFKLASADFLAATSIGNYAFFGCTELASINFPAATSIGNNAFATCYKLESANFSAPTSIDYAAFYNCSELASLILRATTQVCTLSNNNALGITPIASGTGYIYVPAALIDSYKTATNWTTYANQFRALESYTVDGTATGELDPTKVNA